jgi:hypothetical protein
MLDEATISPCGRYRYRLTRELGGSRAVTFVMLNPSTADASIDDPTIRRCKGFARAWGFGRLIVANLYAWRATDPDELRRQAMSGWNVIGHDNDSWIMQAVREAEVVVVAWGPRGDAERARAVLSIIRAGDRVPMCLGFTRDGSPRHPLMMPRSAPLQPFRPEES